MHDLPQVPIPAPPGATAPAEDGKPRVLNRITLKKRSSIPGAGDHSNGQFAALGLRAAHDAGVVVPEEVLRKGAQAWRDRLFADAPGKTPAPRVATGKPGDGALPPGRVAGWGYSVKADPSDSPYEAMTAGGLAALVIFDYLLKKDWKSDPDVETALRWMALHFGESTPRVMPLYSLYAVERAGVLYGTDRFGGVEWYPAGTKVILGLQLPDGSWKKHPPDWSSEQADTCFALLFLKRSTRRLSAPAGK